MKKFAKSLLCLIMALMLVFAVVGCGEDDSSNDDDEDEDEEETKEVKEEKEKDEEEEDKKSKEDEEEEEEEEEPEIDVNGAEEVVEDYISAFLDGDFDKVTECFVDADDFSSDMPTVENLLANMGYSKSDFTDEQIAALEASVDRYVSAALDVVDYEITSVEVDGANMEEVVVELVKTTLDEDQMQEIWNELLAADGFESENDLINYLYEDLNSTGNYTSEEDLVRDTSLAYMITFLEVQVSSVIPACDVIEKTVEAVVVYEDGQWLIESIDE